MTTDSMHIGSLFSWGFYARDVPRILRRRVFGPRPDQSAFVPHVQIGQMLALVACFVVAALSAQSARNGSAVGILLLAIAVIGVLALAIHSAWEARAYPIAPGAFAIGPFVACIILGLDIGLAAGRGREIAPIARVAYAALGVLAGYLAGSVLGLYTQRLGWIAGIVSFLAFAASAGLLLLAYILLV